MSLAFQSESYCPVFLNKVCSEVFFETRSKILENRNATSTFQGVHNG